MIGVETIAKVRRDHFVHGKGIKEICRARGLSRNSVRKILRSEETAFTYEGEGRPLPRIGPWRERLDAMLVANEKRARRDRYRLTRVYDDLKREGYDGSYDAVRRYARRWREARSGGIAQAYVPLSFAPGEAYQFDWSHEYALIGGVTVRIKVAHFRLCYSRMPVLIAYPRETQEMVFDAHDQAFAFYGGVCARGIYDNMSTAVDAILTGKERRFNKRPARRRRALYGLAAFGRRAALLASPGGADGVFAGGRLGLAIVRHWFKPNGGRAGRESGEDLT